MASIKDIVETNRGYADALTEAGVRTTEQLLEVGATSTSRMHLADETHLSIDTIQELVHSADLMRVPGVGSEIAELLRQVGVTTVPKLAYRNPDTLYDDIVEYNDAHRLVKSVPSTLELEKFIAFAKQLPKLIHH